MDKTGSLKHRIRIPKRANILQAGKMAISYKNSGKSGENTDLGGLGGPGGTKINVVVFLLFLDFVG